MHRHRTGVRTRPVSAATGTLRAVLAVIRLDFDPTVTWFGLTVRLETLAIAAALFLAITLAGIGAGRMQSRLDRSEGNGDAEGLPRLRRDDLILIAFGAVPGAVLGGRLGYGLIHFDYYSANPAALADPGQGSFALTLGVLFGLFGALGVARLLAAPIGRWLHVASVPLLIGLSLSKFAMMLGGAGQGSYSDASWTTSYVRPGPWESANPGLSAVPSQALEGGLVLLVALLILVGPVFARFRLRRWRRIVRPGWVARLDWAALRGASRFVTALCLWAIVRLVAAFTWRDAQVLGPFGAEQLVLVAIPGTCVVSIGANRLSRRLRAMRERRKAAQSALDRVRARAAEKTAAEAVKSRPDA